MCLLILFVTSIHAGLQITYAKICETPPNSLIWGEECLRITYAEICGTPLIDVGLHQIHPFGARHAYASHMQKYVGPHQIHSFGAKHAYASHMLKYVGPPLIDVGLHQIHLFGARHV